MKKIFVLFVAALMLSAQQMNAQQRKSTTAKKPTAQVIPVTINEPIGVDGHLAFMGVSQCFYGCNSMLLSLNFMLFVF